MPDVVKHAWTHRPRAQGGTDPIEIPTAGETPWMQLHMFPTPTRPSRPRRPQPPSTSKPSPTTIPTPSTCKPGWGVSICPSRCSRTASTT